MSVPDFLSPGERGIKALFVQDELLHSCLALSHSSSVAITTGFPTHYMHRYPKLIYSASSLLIITASSIELETIDQSVMLVKLINVL